MTTGKLLHNRVCVNEWVRVGLRDGWKDCARPDENHFAESIEGRVIGRTAHRMSVSVAGREGYVVVLRRVDIEAISVSLGR